MKKILKEIKPSIFLTVALVLFLIVSNVIHEIGHYLAARMYGYDATLRYNMTEVDFANKAIDVNESHHFWIAVAGAIQTVILGVIGLIALSNKRKAFNKSGKLKVSEWVFVFLSLSFINYTVNFFLWIIAYSNSPELGVGPDELIIAEYLNILSELLLVTLALIGIFTSKYVFKQYIPQNFKPALLFSIFAGYFLFFTIWMDLLGPLLLP